MEIRCSSPDNYDVMQETSNCLKISFIKKKAFYWTCLLIPNAIKEGTVCCPQRLLFQDQTAVSSGTVKGCNAALHSQQKFISDR